MKPGDMIEWVYKFNNSPVHPDELLRSSTMKQWVPIGGKALLISVADNTLFWLNDKGLFHACVDDTVKPTIGSIRTWAVPRVCG